MMTETPPPLSASPIHIALTFDDNFWAPACALIRSACLSTKRRRDLVFHLCVHELSAEHIADIESIRAELGCTYIYYELADYPDFLRVCGGSAPTAASRRSPTRASSSIASCRPRSNVSSISTATPS